MPAPGSVWAADTWDDDAWASDTWADSEEAQDPEGLTSRFGVAISMGMCFLLWLLGG